MVNIIVKRTETKLFSFSCIIPNGYSSYYRSRVGSRNQTAGVKEKDPRSWSNIGSDIDTILINTKDNWEITKKGINIFFKVREPGIWNPKARLYSSTPLKLGCKYLSRPTC